MNAQLDRMTVMRMLIALTPSETTHAYARKDLLVMEELIA
jgi:hypothetical protein